MQCNVEFGYQLSICSGTKEKPWSSWPVAGPSECKLTSSQQSNIKSASPNISPYLCCCFIIKSVYNFWFTDIKVHIIWSNIPCTTLGKTMHTYMHYMCTEYINLYLYRFTSSWMWRRSVCTSLRAFSARNMESVRSSKSSVHFHQTGLHHDPEDATLPSFPYWQEVVTWLYPEPVHTLHFTRVASPEE
jgi:hypothetical protein